ncbi:MAG TPA: DNA polymerase III subunit gamma/tau [Burkholderiaceae bacterium]|nr:DNA polymerase III subunit gamma/tau [Burkholderiaceae bacterium]
MTYQVLARKWRPRDFQSLIGQDHVVRALTHALQQQRLHHAYLFTGTRGVGKTTIARILAKALNCVGADGQGGITATPCNVCRVCTAIDAGRFVDYIEMDAASNRGVDEMTQLLERAIYAPVDARVKVYTIDEVHMLTAHAFNAMLKTLEEPPDFVKFILATTDPQKIPVTVLSRCLQFNLKQVTPQAIAQRLGEIAQAEQVAAEPAALQALARAARGSMRDALSLLDQAIAYSGGRVEPLAVDQMLGAIDSTLLVQLLDALAGHDAARLLALADAMAERSLSFAQALRDLASLLHRIALAQQAAGDERGDLSDADVARLAQRFTPDEVQLYYQIALHGRNDLGLAPDEYAGFTMTLLRMLAFQPEVAAAAPSLAPGGAAEGRPNRSAALTVSRPPRTAASSFAPGGATEGRPGEAAPAGSRAVAAPAQMEGLPSVAPPGAKEVDLPWPELVQKLKLAGMPRELALRSELVSREADHVRLRVPVKTLLESGAQERLRAALSEYFGRPIRISAEIGATRGPTAAGLNEEARAQRQRHAEESIYSDPFVRELIENFGASVDPASIKPIQDK